MIEIFFFQVFKELAFGLVSIFVPIYLLTQGISLPVILGIFTARSAIHCVTALVFGRLSLSKVGIKHTFIITTILYIASFIAIKQGTSPLLIALWMIFSGAGNALYSSAHHSFLSLKVDTHSAGKEVAFLSIISMIVGIVTPFVGAVMISLFGFKHMLLVGSVFLFFSLIPLFFSREVDTSNQIILKGLSHIKSIWQKQRRIALSTLGNGLDGASNPLWEPLYMYILVGGIKVLGALTSVISFIQMAAHYIGGKRVDQNKSGFEMGINGSIIARLFTFASFHPYIAIMSETANGIIRPLFSTAYTTAFYKQLRGNYTISYVTAHESLWHLAHIGAMTIITISSIFIGWYAFLVAGAFMIIGKMIVRSQRVGA